MSKSKFIKRRVIHNGEWHQPQLYIGCCDCGLVHKIEYRVRNRRIECRCYRAVKMTKESRRRWKHPLHE